MNRARHKIIDIGLLCLFVFLFATFIIATVSRVKGTDYVEKKVSTVPHGEEYDPSFSRLNSVDKMIDFADSFYQANYPNRTYPGIVSEILRKRFYHGYSHYSFGANPISVLLAPVVGNGANAIVLPDDIARYSNAACSQQSIVGMEIFKRKGYQVRKISMFDTVLSIGHFAYEVYYDKGWHFFDTNMEPDADVLKKYNRPSVAFLANHLEIVGAAYYKQPNPDLFERLITSYTAGPINVFPAPNAYIYQVGSKLLSFFGWIVVGFVIVLRAWLKRRKESRNTNFVSVKSTTIDTIHSTLPMPETKARVV